MCHPFGLRGLCSWCTAELQLRSPVTGTVAALLVYVHTRYRCVRRTRELCGEKYTYTFKKCGGVAADKKAQITGTNF